MVKFSIRIPARNAKRVGNTYQLKNTEKRIKADEGYRADLDKNFRSKMESNVYRYLTECHPHLCLVEFEPHLFTDEDGLPVGFKYLPDFRCTTHEGEQFYIEVKGYWDSRSLHALATMHQFRPDIKIYTIDRDIYNGIKKRHAKRTKGWEY